MVLVGWRGRGVAKVPMSRVTRCDRRSVGWNNNTPELKLRGVGSGVYFIQG